MRSFLIKILAIVVLFFVIEKVLWFVMEYQPQKEYDNRLKLVLDGEMNKDIIVFGSSKGAADVLASQLEKETGLSSYNLSYLGSDITYHDFVLETLLRYNKSPKKIIFI